MSSPRAPGGPVRPDDEPLPQGAVERKIDLYCRGLVLDPSSEGHARLSKRTRAGLGSGLELVLQGRHKDVWVNVPVVEPFAKASPYRLKHDGTGFLLVDERDEAEIPVTLPPEPAFYEKKTARGVAMGRIGVMQGTYLGVYVGARCLYWKGKAELACRFCTTGLNVGTVEEGEKTVGDVVETWQAAREETGAVFIHFNTGYQAEDREDREGLWGADRMAPYVAAVKAEVGGLAGVQAMPLVRKHFDRYDRLVDLGADHFSFCYEFHDPKVFAQVCPGKATTHSQAAFFEAMAYTVRKLPRGAVSGEIIAGVEPIETTLEAIEFITSMGAFPTVCVFRPTVGSRMETVAPPRFSDMRRVLKAMYDACRKHLVPIGTAPIDVSIVVTPEDARELADEGFTETMWRAALWARRKTAQPVLDRKLRPIYG